MLQLQTPKQRPWVYKVQKFICEFPDLIHDGTKIICKVCDNAFMFRNKYECKKHVDSAQHKKKKDGVGLNSQFIFDLGLTLITCNVPFNLLDNESFCSFWNKYSDWKLPSRTTLRKNIKSVRDKIEKSIKSELKNKKVWLCVDESTDRQKNSVLNVMVRTMEPLKPSLSILLASKRLEKCTAEVIAKEVLNTMKKFEISKNQLLMFMTDGTVKMLSVGWCLKQHCGNLLHVTCKVHALHLVAEAIRMCYPEVDGLIVHTKAVFLKSPKRIREFRRQCPDIPEPSQPILTRWGAWLKTAFYYFQHFQKIKAVVSQFHSNEATAIKESQKKLQDVRVEADLQIIYKNYNGLVEALEKLQNSSLSLVESMQIVNTVQTQLHALSDARNISIVVQVDTVLTTDSDFSRLKQIFGDTGSTDPLSIYKDYFNYASISSLDVERSFSAYNNIYSSQRTRLHEKTVETYLMLQIFNRSYPLCASAY